MQVKTAPDEIQDYLKDTSNMPGGHAERLVMPSSIEEVQAVMHDANAAKIPVTISGARTGTVGGAIPFGGWVISLEKLNKINSVDRKSMTMIVEPGATLDEVKKAADAEGLLYPPDPTEWSCQIGGTIATNASGARSFKYGSTRRWVDRLKVVLADGDILDLKRGEVFSNDGLIRAKTASGREINTKVPTYERPDVTKNVSGYYSALPVDAIDVFIGSEGTLGVIVEAQLKLAERPEGTFSGVVFFERREDLVNFVDSARELSRERTTPSSSKAGMPPRLRKEGSPVIDASLLEYFDDNSLKFIAERFPESPVDIAGAVYFEQQTSAESEDMVFAAWNELLEKHDADLERSWFTTTEQDKEKMRAFRHALPLAANERYTRSGFRKVSTDMAVPVDGFRGLLKFYEDTCGASGIDHIMFGHIGDCHLHLNLFPKNEDEATRARHIYGRCVAQAVMLGGCISAEHGTGKLKRKYLAAMMGERYLNEMSELKRAFDPNGILGRGNMFDESYL
ncbi:MAG TPA: FAD-binding oxidoreductase [Pyrinomonadaceae bacterium]|jgi:D-lactate dehydrogenase (cytochrome)|nr:FAD-binding oxidoreductase [Pyrinomonadaceae bacterium]